MVIDQYLCDMSLSEELYRLGVVKEKRGYIAEELLELMPHNVEIYNRLGKHTAVVKVDRKTIISYRGFTESKLSNALAKCILWLKKEGHLK